MSGHSQYYGELGFQSPELAKPKGKACKVAVIRELYRAGKLSLSALTLAVCKPSDHGHAVKSGKVTVEALLAVGVDLRKAEVAYNRATGDGSKARRQRQAMVAAPSTVELAVIKTATDASEREALAKLAEQREAKRKEARAAKAGKVLSPAEIAAVAASLGVSASAKVG